MTSKTSLTSSNNTVLIVGGGQSGLTAALAASQAGLHPVVLEAGERPSGSWPRYYDSLRLFSPGRFSTLAGPAFPGEPDAYPARDEVADYVTRFADTLDAEIRTNTRVVAITEADSGFAVHTADGEELPAAGVVAASGSFGNPYSPELPGAQGFTGEVLYVADYRNPEPFAGKRVVVVGAGNSAVQVGYELAQVATTTLATRQPLHFIDQIVNGRDLHHALTATGFDQLPPQWLARLVTGTLVLDTGKYREAVASGLLERRKMFTGFDGEHVVWADGSREPVDVVLFATGYRPSLGYLRPLGALAADGTPQHVGGISATHPGLVYVGLEFQRSFSSNTLRGVYADAEYVMAPLAAHVRGAGSIVTGTAILGESAA